MNYWQTETRMKNWLIRSPNATLRHGKYIDGALNQKGSGVGLVLTSSEKVIVEKSLRLDFPATNNEAKYEALLEGIAMVQRMGGKSIKLFSDSRLVVGQVNGEFEAKDERMRGYLSQVKTMQSKFESFNLLHVPRSGNAYADSLAMLATSSAQNLPRVILVEDLRKPSGTLDMVQINQVRAGPSWMDSITQFLKEDKLKLARYEERLLVIGCRRTASYIGIPFQGLICYVFISNKPNHS